MIPYKDLAPARRFPWMTVLLIAVNVAIFAYQILLPEVPSIRFVYKYAIIPLEFKLGRNIQASPGFHPFLSVFTSMFLHGGWFHIVGNMLYLWIFGDNVEDRMGPFRFLAFYLLCGVVASFAQIYGSFASEIPALGASGAIAGVLAAYLRLYPRARVAVLVPLFYVFRAVLLPAWVVLGFWFLAQVLEAQMNPVKETGGVAYFAHIGGFVAGLLVLPLFVGRGGRKKRK